ncbi:hypothetical protein [Kitasatospora sp. NPDC006786]|uniref:hypothetical protein n=1 Tax=unclassified Kitasatospora TaxID=2633591 RepID=UPI0033EE146A
MIDLEHLLTRVHNPDVRPLVQDAHRAYATGIPRAAIVLTWTAVCADLIAEAQALSDDGESDARALAEEVEKAQQLVAATDEKQRRDGVKKMLDVERDILDAALKLELIDRSQHVQLDRLREDRHQSAHPSLRPLGELYEPTTEYARAHLVAALDAVLIHPPSQGRKVQTSFAAHVADPGFVLNTGHLTHTYFDRVRPAARNKVVDFAAKFAVLQIADASIALPADQLADRMAECLRCFADRDMGLVELAVAKQMEKLGKVEPAVQLAALARLGNLSAFWKAMPETLSGLFASRIEQIGKKGADPVKSLAGVEIKALGLVTYPELRQRLPELEKAFTGLDYLNMADAINRRPDAYYTPYLPDLLAKARSFDLGQAVAKLAVLPCAQFVDLESLEKILRAWWGNTQCWGRLMTGYLEEFYQATAHQGPERDTVWRSYLEELREYESTIYRDLSRRLALPEPGETAAGAE